MFFKRSDGLRLGVFHHLELRFVQALYRLAFIGHHHIHQHQDGVRLQRGGRRLRGCSAHGEQEAGNSESVAHLSHREAIPLALSCHGVTDLDQVEIGIAQINRLHCAYRAGAFHGSEFNMITRFRQMSDYVIEGAFRYKAEIS